MPKTNAAGLAWLVVLVLGIVLLAIPLWLTAQQAFNATDRDCTVPAAAPAPGAVIAVAHDDFRLAQGLCLGVNVPVYFAAQRQAAPQGAGKRIATLQIYFDRHATPAKVAIDIDAPGWTWVPVPLRPVANADSADGRDWRKLLTDDGVRPQRNVIIGVAVRSGDTVPPLPDAVTARTARLEVINIAWTVMGALGLAGIAAGIVMACWNTGLLRDRPPGAAAADKPPFSLGRVQMAVWLVLTVGGFLAIWLITGLRTGIVTSGVLTLLGISATSGLAARMIDVANPAPADAQSAGFWRDIVSEGYGADRTVAVHRLQMVAWTLILGGMFAWSVFTTFAFPDFDSNLLLLLGISSGTYIGFKFPEKGTGA